MYYTNKSSIGILTVLFLLALTACRTSRPVSNKKPDSQPATKLESLFKNSKVFSDNFTGFELYDPQSDSVIYAQNEKRYFTPASNTKLFTFYTSLKHLPERLPALKYVSRGDSLIFWGTGDPSFLRSDLDNGTVYKFLKNSSKDLYYSDSNFRDKGLGPGWAWDDYQYSYSAERSPLPMYGNLVRFKMQRITSTRILGDSTSMQIAPAFFRSHTQQAVLSGEHASEPLLSRGFSDNQFRYVPQSDTSIFYSEKPYHYTPRLITAMLSDTLGKPVHYIKRELPANAKTLHSVLADTVYKHMLKPSDNYIAEQLLLVNAAEMGKPLDSRWVINKMKKTYLKDIPDEPQWVDGSGLSNYDLFTPRSMIWLLRKINAEFKNDQDLFDLLPTGGESGTIRNWYGARDGGPAYVFAKTGTLSHDHCLTGFIITKSGHKLLFSFMNNHYITSSSVVKREMEKVLWYIHQHY